MHTQNTVEYAAGASKPRQKKGLSDQDGSCACILHAAGFKDRDGRGMAGHTQYITRRYLRRRQRQVLSAVRQGLATEGRDLGILVRGKGCAALARHTQNRRHTHGHIYRVRDGCEVVLTRTARAFVAKVFRHQARTHARMHTCTPACHEWRVNRSCVAFCASSVWAMFCYYCYVHVYAIQV